MTAHLLCRCVKCRTRGGPQRTAEHHLTCLQEKEIQSPPANRTARSRRSAIHTKSSSSKHTGSLSSNWARLRFSTHSAAGSQEGGAEELFSMRRRHPQCPANYQLPHTRTAALCREEWKQYSLWFTVQGRYIMHNIHGHKSAFFLVIFHLQNAKGGKALLCSTGRKKDKIKWRERWWTAEEREKKLWFP